MLNFTLSFWKICFCDWKLFGFIKIYFWKWRKHFEFNWKGWVLIEDIFKTVKSFEVIITASANSFSHRTVFRKVGVAKILECSLNAPNLSNPVVEGIAKIVLSVKGVTKQKCLRNTAIEQDINFSQQAGFKFQEPTILTRFCKR